MKLFNIQGKLLVIAPLLAVFTLLLTTSVAHAATFDPTRIIDNGVFYNSSSMSVQQIQDFLNSKVPTCDTNHAGYVGGSGTTYSPPWVCLKDYYEDNSSTYTVSYSYQDTSGVFVNATRTFTRNNAYVYTALTNPTYYNGDYHQGLKSMAATIQNVGGTRPANSISAAQIIWNAAQAYGINPQVLLVTLQKENSLITDTWPAPWQYQQAMGYGCFDYTPCNSQYSGFYNQVDAAAWQFRAYANNPNGYNFVPGPGNNVYYSPVTSTCPSPTYSTLNIQNQATASLYDYTPYQPNTAALVAGYGTGDGCSAYGNRNFWLYFNAWFGSPYAFIYKGISYSPVFDPIYYLINNPDVQQATGGDQLAAFNHFIYYGMKEGRQGGPNFNVTSYRNRYPDLRWAFGVNLPAYYVHYLTNGQAESRTAIGAVTLQPVTTFNGIDYSSVYDFSTYMAMNSDLNSKYGNNDTGALWHFINYGMSEGRQASVSFSVQSYQAQWYDLRRVFGTNLKAFYIHYIAHGKAEDRIATGSYLGGTTTLNGIDYSAAYNVNDYENYNSDIKKTYALDDIAALNHFVNYGMNEGRQASSTFNVYAYKASYSDLRTAFGDNLKAYYMHFITNGKAEGRSGI